MILLFELVKANVIYCVQCKIRYDLGMIIELIVNVANWNKVYLYYYHVLMCVVLCDMIILELVLI
jgi:hypothetical protein